MTDTPAKLRRRWLSFSLRTLLVTVTVLACYAGWAVRWVQKRTTFLATHDIMATAWDSTSSAAVSDLAPRTS